MAANKTQRDDDADVDAFLDGVVDERRREDARDVCALMAEVTGAEPTMWGSAMVGFGEYAYTYASGRSGEWFRVGLSPRKQALTIYLMDGFETHGDLLERLGPHSTGKACLYVKRLEQVDTDVLRELVRESWENSAMGEGG